MKDLKKLKGAKFIPPLDVTDINKDLLSNDNDIDDNVHIKIDNDEKKNTTKYLTTIETQIV